MRILILGGTIFLGKHLAQAALTAGHDVTLFHRGQHGADLFPGAKHVLGDRGGDLAGLDGQTWDAVIDTSAYFPDWVERSARALSKRAGQYVFVSSISVHPTFPTVGQNEDAPLAEVDDAGLAKAYDLRSQGPVRAAVLGELYGALKVRCEREAQAAFGERALIVRPGLIGGPDDYSDRFTYWVERMQRGGTVLAPGRPEGLAAVIDVRDLAAWMLRMIEGGRAGVFQAAGDPHSFEAMLHACTPSQSVEPLVVWVPEGFLSAEGVAPWSELPLWVEDEPDHKGFSAVDCGRAKALGLTLRPLAETAQDTWTWARTRPADLPRRAGLDAAREQRLIERWRQKSTT